MLNAFFGILVIILAENIESYDFMSWEQYFSRLLTEKSNGGYLQYSKKELNKTYLQPKGREQIVNRIPMELRGIIM